MTNGGACPDATHLDSPRMSRRAAVSLFRRIARAGKTFGGDEDVVAALNEARAAFRARDARVDVAKALADGEKRLELALHYGIVAERLEHSRLAGGGNKDVEPPEGAGARSEALRATMASQFPANPAATAARAKARARRAAVAKVERESERVE